MAMTMTYVDYDDGVYDAGGGGDRHRQTTAAATIGDAIDCDGGADDGDADGYGRFGKCVGDVVHEDRRHLRLFVVIVPVMPDAIVMVSAQIMIVRCQQKRFCQEWSYDC